MNDRVTPIRTFTEHDVKNIRSLNLDNPRVLAALCRVMSVDITTKKLSLGLDCWFLNAPTAGEFAGTYAEAKAWVFGYAAAWLFAQHSEARLIERLRFVLDGKAPKEAHP